MGEPVCRQERDGTWVVVGCADSGVEALQVMAADRDTVDWDAGYRWEGHKIEAKSDAGRGSEDADPRA